MSFFYVFLPFALAQLPVGIALDRYGPRKVQPLLMLFAALGALMFAHGRSFAELMIARAVIKCGMGGCFMAALHAVPQPLAGRAATCLNLSVFVGAFLMQAGFGQMVGFWQPDLAGHYPAQAYRVAFGMLVLLQLPGLATYFAGYFLRRRQVECGIALLAQKEEYEIGSLRPPR